MTSAIIATQPQNTQATPSRRWIGEAPIFVIGAALMALCVGLLMARGIYPSVEGILVNARLFAPVSYTHSEPTRPY